MVTRVFENLSDLSAYGATEVRTQDQVILKAQANISTEPKTQKLSDTVSFSEQSKKYVEALKAGQRPDLEPPSTSEDPDSHNSGGKDKNLSINILA